MHLVSKLITASKIINLKHTSQNKIYINLNSERVIAVWKFSKGYELIIMGVKTEIERRIVEKCPF